MALTALPVHLSGLWCHDPELERWVSAKMYHENFALQIAMMLIQLGAHAACATVDPNLGVYSGLPLIFLIPIRIYLHTLPDRAYAQRTGSLIYTLFDLFTALPSFVFSLYFPLHDLVRIEVEAPAVHGRVGMQPTGIIFEYEILQQYLSGIPSWVPFLLVVSAFVTRRAANEPTNLTPIHLLFTRCADANERRRRMACYRKANAAAIDDNRVPSRRFGLWPST